MQMSYEEFISNYGEYIRKVEEEDAKPENYNVFNILGLEDQEIRHSRFLKWLLYYKNEDGNREFFERFLEILNKKIEEHNNVHTEKLDIINVSDEERNNKVNVYREDTFNEVNQDGYEVRSRQKDKVRIFSVWEKGKIKYFTLSDPDEDTKNVEEMEYDECQLTEKEKNNFKKCPRHIDVNIIGETFTITVENKVYARHHDFQCRAYYNYMSNCEKYKEKKHYYVYLGMEKPEEKGIGFDELTGTKSVFPEYIYVDYEDIKEILIAMCEKGCFKRTVNNEDGGLLGILPEYIVKQYIAVINNWKHLPEAYKSICSNIENPDEFVENKTYQELLSIANSEAERRFLRVARQYFRELKEKANMFIKPILESLLYDKDFIKGYGNYANAIPLSYNAFSDTEKKIYLKLKKIDEKTAKKQNGAIAANKKIKLAFQTVDYRAPMRGLENISIAIYAGLNKDYSEELIKKIVNKDLKFVNALDDLQNKGWKVEFIERFKDGGKQHVAFESEIDVKELNKMSARDRQQIFSVKNIKTLYAKDLLSNEYWKFVEESGLYTDSEKKNLAKNIKRFFVSENMEIKATKEAIYKFVEESKLDIVPEVGKKNDLLNINKYLEENDKIDDPELVDDLIWIDDFWKEQIKKCKPELNLNKKIEGKKIHLEESYECIGNENVKKAIKNLLCSSVETQEYQSDVAVFSGEQNSSDDKKGSTIITLLKQKLDKRKHKEVFRSWCIILTWVSKNTDVMTYLKNENPEEEPNIDMKKIQSDLEKEFYNKTIEGVSIFGTISGSSLIPSEEMTYQELFKNFLFKENEE